MSGRLQDTSVHFRVSGAVASALIGQAKQAGVSVSGYYGALALGGAKAAGLRNPLAGMPPPPPGFTLDKR